MIANLFSRHSGAERAENGIYWSHHGGFVSLPSEGGVLPGTHADSYTRVPVLAVLVAGPILGTAFALFLPAAAIVGLAQILLGRLSAPKAPTRAPSRVGLERPTLSVDSATESTQ